MTMPSKCKACSAEIDFYPMKSGGKSMPIDAEPVAAGNIRKIHTSRGIFLEVVRSDDVTVAETPLYTSHFATCPAAASFRKKH
jgi:hypothetical protein